jgi:threonine dehydrogenase-like Zn-dependent dehydrogenase
MKALRYENGKLSVSEVAKPLADGEALVRVTLSGICNTDLEIARGYAGFEGTLGHEFVGVIESLPDTGALARPTGVPTRAARVGWSIGRARNTEPLLTRGLMPRGQRVVGEINAGCGTCDLCRAGDPRHCAQRTVLGIVNRDGAHAEYLKLPLVNLLSVPDGIPDEQAVFTEPLAAACGILEQTSITEDTRVAVIGDGKLGLLCAQVIATTGAPITLLGKHQNKLQIAQRRGIETMTVDEAETRSRKFDVAVEASGSPSGFTLALDLLHPRGVLVLKSTFHGATEIDAARLVVEEITVVGSRCGRFTPALELLKTNSIDVESLITDEFNLTDGVEAMQRAAEPGVMKVLLRP